MAWSDGPLPETAAAPASTWHDGPVGQQAQPQPSQLPALPTLQKSVEDKASETAGKYGVPGWALRTMFDLESGGQKDPTTAYNQSSGAYGVGQMKPSTFKGVMGDKADIHNAADQYEATGKYYRQLVDQFKNPVIAAGAYNWGPANMEAYLKTGKGADGRPMPPETKRYMMYVMAADTDHHSLPLPPLGVDAVDKPRNQDPARGNYNALEKLGGYMDIVPAMINSASMDYLSGYRGDPAQGPHAKEARDFLLHNPGALGAKYGVNSPESLEVYSKLPGAAGQLARTLKANPMLAAGATFVEEIFNPTGWATGEVANTMLREIHQRALFGNGYLQPDQHVERAPRGLTHAFSPYKDLVAAHGEGPRNFIASEIGSKFNRIDAEAVEKHMLPTYKGYTQAEQFEIDRLQNGLSPAGTLEDGSTPDPGRYAEMRRMADKKREQVRIQTGQLWASGARKKADIHGNPSTDGQGPGDPAGRAARYQAWLGQKGRKPSDVYVDKYEGMWPISGVTHDGKTVRTWLKFDPGTYVPTKGAYNNPISPEYNTLLKELGVGKGGGVSSEASKKFQTLDEARASKEFNYEEYDAADRYRRYIAGSSKEAAFETAMKRMAEKYPDVIFVPPDQGRAAFIESKGGNYVALQDALNKGVTSDWLRKAVVSKEFFKLMTNDNNLSILTGLSMSERGAQSADWVKWANSYNGLMRNTIIYNPSYHPFWNIFPSTVAALKTAPLTVLPRLMTEFSRVLLGRGATALDLAGGVERLGTAWKGVGGALHTAARVAEDWQEKLAMPWLHGVADYQTALEEAVRAGADADLGGPRTALGGNLGSVLTRPWETAEQGWDALLTRANDWNREATFGKRGEQAFAVSLYNQLRHGPLQMDEYAAAWATREALGNYRNINPESWPSKLMFFYPWLKTNVPFWFKTFLTKPQLVVAPTMASRDQRELAGDPLAYDSGGTKEGTVFYAGKDAKGQDNYYTAPLPWKDAARLADSLLGVSEGDQSVKQAGMRVAGELASRAKPLVGTAFNTAATFVDERANTPGSFHGYTTMFNSNMDAVESAKEFAGTAGEQLVPVPAPFVAHDLMRGGIDPTRMGAYITELVGAGYITPRTADSFKKAEGKINSQLERVMVKAKRAEQSGAVPQDKINEMRATARGNYKQLMEQLKAAVDAQAQKKPGGNPPGWNDGELPTGWHNGPVSP